MQTVRVVPALDVLEHHLPGNGARWKHALNGFRLERAPNALLQGVVITGADGAHGQGHAGQTGQIVGTGVLCALVGMMHLRQRPAPADGHLQRRDDQLAVHAFAHRPANDAPGTHIRDTGQVQPAFSRGDVGDVHQPFLVEPLGAERLAEPVRFRGGPFGLASGLEAARLHPLQRHVTHQPRHPSPPHPLARLLERRVHPWRTVRLPALRVNRLDLDA